VKQIQVFFENLIESSKKTQSHSEPSFLWIKRTGAPWGEHEGLITPVARFLSMNLCRAASSPGTRSR